MNWNPNYRDVEVFSQCWKLFEAFWRAWSRIQVWLKSPGGQEAITNYITKSKNRFSKILVKCNECTLFAHQNSKTLRNFNYQNYVEFSFEIVIFVITSSVSFFREHISSVERRHFSPLKCVGLPRGRNQGSTDVNRSDTGPRKMGNLVPA